MLCQRTHDAIMVLLGVLKSDKPDTASGMIITV